MRMTDPDVIVLAVIEACDAASVDISLAQARKVTEYLTARLPALRSDMKPRAAWTRWEDADIEQLRELRESGCSYKECADSMGKTVRQVSQAVDRYGLQTKKLA